MICAASFFMLLFLAPSFSWPLEEAEGLQEHLGEEDYADDDAAVEGVKRAIDNIDERAVGGFLRSLPYPHEENYEEDEGADVGLLVGLPGFMKGNETYDRFGFPIHNSVKPVYSNSGQASSDKLAESWGIGKEYAPEGADVDVDEGALVRRGNHRGGRRGGRRGGHRGGRRRHRHAGAYEEFLAKTFESQTCRAFKHMAKGRPSFRYSTLGKHCYLFSKVKKTWSEARDFCKKKGGDLVAIENEAENAFVHNTIHGDMGVKDYILLGAIYDKSLGWHWVATNEKLNFSKWNTGRPQSVLMDPTHVLMDPNQETWQDWDQIVPAPFVCEEHLSAYGACEVRYTRWFSLKEMMSMKTKKGSAAAKAATQEALKDVDLTKLKVARVDEEWKLTIHLDDSHELPSEDDDVARGKITLCPWKSDLRKSKNN